MKIELTVNGQEHSLDVPPEATLLEALREQLNLFGAREGCGIGMCGACTVLLDGRAVSSCILLAAQADGREVVTVEGLAEDEGLHPVQQAFLDQAGFQCAFCTPGFILTTVALLREHPQPDEATIRAYLNGNLCRCGSYRNILAAVQQAAGQKS